MLILKYYKLKIAKIKKYFIGAIAQLGERLNGIQEVGGSIPLGSTIFIFKLKLVYNNLSSLAVKISIYLEFLTYFIQNYQNIN